MIVLEFSLMRMDLLKRDDETAEQHTARMTAIMEAQLRYFEVPIGDRTEEPEELRNARLETDKLRPAAAFTEYKNDFPDWLVEMIKELPPISVWERLGNWFKRLFGEGRIRQRAMWDPDNRAWKVFFRTKEEAVAACGWKTKDEPDTPGVFQKRFQQSIAADGNRIEWAKSNRVQITGLTDVNDIVLQTDMDLQDFYREDSQ